MIALRVDVTGANILEQALSPKQIAYATVNALNLTAKDVQKKQRENVARVFTVRKTEFIRREAAIIDFASVSKGRTEAVVRVGEKTRLLLSQFEKGGRRTGFVGKNVAVPVTGGARPTKRSEIPAEFRFANMKLRAYRGRQLLKRKARGKHVRTYGVFGQYGRLALPEAGNRVQWRGTNRTYLVPGVGVFQRTGPRSSRLLWAFRPSVQLLPQLRFVATGEPVALQSYQKHIKREIEEAFAHNARKLIRAIGGGA